MFVIVESWMCGNSYATEALALEAARKRLGSSRSNDTYVIAEITQAFKPKTVEVEIENVPLEEVFKKDCDCEESRITPTLS